LKIPAVGKHLTEETGDWNAVLITVPAYWIRDLYKTHHNDLFSANYREYLGYSENKENVNHKIVSTANEEPENFWVYNNGITALTNEIDFHKSKKKRIRGISIINGAQTSGALGDSSEQASKQAKVLMRIVECKSPGLIDNIIEYNNTQNDIKPEDRRSKDEVQKRLGVDFKKYNIEYLYRRSHKKVAKTMVTCKAVAPALCAFHGDPQVSYRDPKKIFKDDETYQSVFPKNIQVEHIFLIRSLTMALDIIKADLKDRVGKDDAKEQDRKQFQVLRFPAAKHFILYLVGELAEEIMNKKVTNLFSLKCKPEYISSDNESLIKSWRIVLSTLLPYIASTVERRGTDAFYDVPRSEKSSTEVAKELKVLIASLAQPLGRQFQELRKKVTV
jgi:hypothetical protein